MPVFDRPQNASIVAQGCQSRSECHELVAQQELFSIASREPVPSPQMLPISQRWWPAIMFASDAEGGAWGPKMDENHYALLDQKLQMLKNCRI